MSSGEKKMAGSPESVEAGARTSKEMEGGVMEWRTTCAKEGPTGTGEGETIEGSPLPRSSGEDIHGDLAGGTLPPGG